MEIVQLVGSSIVSYCLLDLENYHDKIGLDNSLYETGSYSILRSPFTFSQLIEDKFHLK